MPDRVSNLAKQLRTAQQVEPGHDSCWCGAGSTGRQGNLIFRYSKVAVTSKVKKDFFKTMNFG